MKIFLKIVDSSFFLSSHRVYRYFHVTTAPLNYPVERVRLKVDALDSRLLRNTNAPLTFKYDLYDMSHTTCLFIEIVLWVTFKPKSHRSFNPYWQILEIFFTKPGYESDGFVEIFSTNSPKVRFPGYDSYRTSQTALWKFLMLRTESSVTFDITQHRALSFLFHLSLKVIMI